MVEIEYVEDTEESQTLELAAAMRKEMPLLDMAMQLLQLPQVDCPVIHRFGPGLYIREVTFPAGAIVVGHRQKTRHMNVFLKGRITMLNEDGSMTDLAAPMIFTAEPGRKCGYMHEDVVWMNIYPTDETDVETLEDMYLDKTPDWREFSRRRELALAMGAGDVEYCRKALAERTREGTESDDDVVPLPLGSYKVMVSNSRIDGRGIFATANIDPGEIIAPAKLENKNTPVGKYTKHSTRPNARMEQMGQDVYLVAIRHIHGHRGGLLGDEITTDGGIGQ